MGPQELGAQGEVFVLDLFRSAGVDAEQGGPGDIILGNGVTLEVKASLPTGKRQRYQFCLYRAYEHRVKTDARKSDLVVLLAYATPKSDPTVFVIPSSRLNGQKNIKIPSEIGRYTGKWSWFIGWDRALNEVEL